MSSKEIKLEWHEPKRQNTLHSRDLDFAMAREVFADPNVKEYIDNRKNYGESRIRKNRRSTMAKKKII